MELNQTIVDGSKPNLGTPKYADDFSFEWQLSKLSLVKKALIHFAINWILLVSSLLIGTYWLIELQFTIPTNFLMGWNWFGALVVFSSGVAALTVIVRYLVIKPIAHQFQASNRLGIQDWPSFLLGLCLFVVLGKGGLFASFDHRVAIVIAGILLSIFIFVWPTLFKAYTHDLLLQSMRRLWAHRGLVILWTRYNIQARYKSAALGIFWAVLEPSLSALMFAFMFGVLRAVPPTQGVPYAAYLVPGFIVYGWMTSSINGSCRSLISQLVNMGQVNYPREAVVLSFLGQKTFDFVVGLLFIVFINTVIFGISPSLILLIAFAILFFAQLFLIGIAFGLSIAGVIVRDTAEVVQLLIRPLLFVFPVLLSFEQMPYMLQAFNVIIPLARVIDSVRNVLVFHMVPSSLVFFYIASTSIVMFFMGYIYYVSTIPRILDYQ